MKKSSLKPYKTSDTSFAAFLHYSGQKLITSRQDPNDYKREVLVFLYTPACDELEKEWKLGLAKGDLRNYYRSYKMIARFVKEARAERDKK